MYSLIIPIVTITALICFTTGFVVTSRPSNFFGSYERRQSKHREFVVAKAASVEATGNDVSYDARGPADVNKNNIDTTLQELLAMARRLGPVGVRNSLDDQQRINDTVIKLKDQLKNSIINTEEMNYTNVPLVGVHDLIYSAAPGGSSGKIGPVHGKVTQTFVNATTFINAVDLGPLRIALTANRQIKNEKVIAVKFEHTTVSLFGIPLIEKSIRGTGGVWKVIYTGIVNDTNVDDHQKRLIRIMETPSLFIIEQKV